MRYADINFSEADARVVEGILMDAFAATAERPEGEERRVIRALIYRLRKSGLLDKVTK